MALDAKLRAVQDRKARFAKFDANRKRMVDELDERERAVKKAKMDKEAEEKERMRQNDLIMEQGRILREEREKRLKMRELEREEAERRARAPQGADDEEVKLPTIGMFSYLQVLKQILILSRSFGHNCSREIRPLLTPRTHNSCKLYTTSLAFRPP